MTTNALELVLYDLGTRKASRSEFAADPGRFLERYRLDADEARMVVEFDVRHLQDRGVSPLLTIGFWMLNAPVKTRTAYLARLAGNRLGD